MKIPLSILSIILITGSAIAHQYPQRLTLNRSTNALGEQKAIETIIASNQLDRSTTTHYTAGQSVTLQPGFVAQAGSVFTATVSVVSSGTSREGANLSVRAYPNPFIDQTTVEYSLPAKGSVHHRLMDAKGQEIKQLEILTEQLGGTHQLTLEGNTLPAGIYLYQLQVGTESRTLRLIKNP